jgi:hypothetical protein
MWFHLYSVLCNRKEAPEKDTDKSTIKCFYYKKSGYVKLEYRKRKKDLEKK